MHTEVERGAAANPAMHRENMKRQLEEQREAAGISGVAASFSRAEMAALRLEWLDRQRQEQEETGVRLRGKLKEVELAAESDAHRGRL